MSSNRVISHPQLDAIVGRLRAGESFGSVAREYDLNRNTLKSWWARHKDDAPEAVSFTVDQDDLDAELDRAVDIARRAKARGLDVSSISVEASDRESEWDGWRKDSDEPGTAVSDRQTSQRSERKARVTVKLPAGDIEAAPQIRQAEPVNVNLRMPRPPRRDKGELRTAFVFPDIQFPFHDAAAVDVAEQLLAYVEQSEGVDDIVWLGDDLDFPELSRHRTAPAVLGDIQTGVDVCYRHKARARAICPDATAYWLLGNHEQRLTNWLVDNAPQLIGMRRAGETTAPVLSVEYLCRTEELGIQVVGPYPEGSVWLNDSLRLIHGDKTGAHPETTYLNAMECSTIYGHTHRSVIAYREVDRGPQGLRSYLAGSPGCLARLDGLLPSTKGGVDSSGRPGRRHNETWQQGVMVLRYNPNGGELPSAHVVRIINGAAEWEGRQFTAGVDTDGNPLAV